MAAQRNVQRDAETNSKLESLGWTVLRFWEHEEVDTVVETIVKAYEPRGEGDTR